ncbi:MAG TPA: hypothetical protein VK613_08850 [Gaiellaceae bacterium]|nr:hypothetical protein [Gaiellaceae bacterium]
MRRAAIVALVATWFLVVTAGAEAKEPPAGFQLCGSNGCATIGMDDGESLAISLFFGGGSVELWTPATTPAPFYSLRWSYEQGQLHTAYFVPDLDMVRFVGNSASPTVDPRGAIHWLRLDSQARAILDRIATPLQPTPAPSPSTVMVGGRAVQDPASYLRLWSVGKPTYSWPRGGFLKITVTCNVASPWTDESAHLSIARRRPFLLRDSTILRISAKLARQVRARSSLG